MVEHAEAVDFHDIPGFPVSTGARSLCHNMINIGPKSLCHYMINIGTMSYSHNMINIGVRTDYCSEEIEILGGFLLLVFDVCFSLTSRRLSSSYCRRHIRNW